MLARPSLHARAIGAPLRIAAAVLACALLSACRSLSEPPRAERPPASGLTQAALDAMPEAGRALGAGFALGEFGSLAEDPAEVVAGGRSIRGACFSGRDYSLYASTDPAVIPLEGGGTYRAAFDYRIIAASERGFETLFYSPTGAREQNWMQSKTIVGTAGESGTFELTNTLGPYADYCLFWNVVGNGAIAIDSIRLSRLRSAEDPEPAETLLEEDAEPARYALAQKFLPQATEGRGYCAELRAIGGEEPYAWAGLGPMPPGLALGPDGTFAGKPVRAGTYLLSARVRDSSGVPGSIRFRLDVRHPAEADPRADLAVERGPGSRATYRYEPYELSFRNPLRGMRPYAGSAREHPWASLARQYIEWNLLERDAADTVERIRAVTDALIGDLPSYNVKVIPRVYLKWPPDAEYWPSDLHPGDYSSGAFKKRVMRLIARLGEAWDHDPRIAYIEMGILGDWGEQHHPWFASSGSDRDSLSASFERAIGEAFASAFEHKLIMNRYPQNFRDFTFGIHWDVFGSFEGRGRGNSSSSMSSDLRAPRLAERWKIAPMGGEIDPTFLGEPDWSEASQQNMVRKHADRLIGLAKGLHWNHLAVLERVDPADAELWEGASRVERALGYRFVIESAAYDSAVEAGRPFRLELAIRNEGSSPFYYEWPLELSLLDPETRAPVWKARYENVGIPTWLPGERVLLGLDVAVPEGFASGRYILAAAVLDPAGMLPSLRFAVRSYYNGGRTPLGALGVDADPEPLEIGGFDDLASDRSLFYVPDARR